LRRLHERLDRLERRAGEGIVDQADAALPAIASVKASS